MDSEAVFNEEWEEWDRTRDSFFVHALAGSAAGVMEHVAMFPADTIKTHLQAAHADGVMGRQRLHSVKVLVKQGGLLRLWRGAPGVAAACIPSHAAYFTVYEHAKEAFGANASGHHPIAAGAAGALSTTLHDAFLTPMDMVKQRLQLGQYSSVAACVRATVRNEGFSAFYRSYPTTVLMNIPYAATVVAVNESAKEVLNPSGEHDMWTYLLSGGIAGGVAALVTNPLDVVKTRLQTQGGVLNAVEIVGPAAVEAAELAPTYTGLRDTARKIYAKEGAAGFMQGAKARLALHTPSMAISWGTYEFVKNLLRGSEPTP
mmetsp:Transcript_19096/g.67449  ORF Transcript_19096/g.67449 Transcript_19096/m.67449 type:complete len:316 (-) Transcript_19096:139-1086(-)